MIRSFLYFITARSRLSRLDLLIIVGYAFWRSNVELSGWQSFGALFVLFLVFVVGTIIEYELHPEQSTRRGR